jgi:hypothetical protein
LSIREAGAALQVTEGVLASLLAKGELRDVGPSYVVEFDPIQVFVKVQDWAEAGRVSRLCVLAARLIAEGRVDIPEPTTKSAPPLRPRELIEVSRPMPPCGPMLVERGAT